MTRPWRRRRRRRVTNEFRKKEVDIILAWSVRGDGHPASSRTAVLSSLHLDSFASPAHLVSFTEVLARDCTLTLSARPLYHTSDAWRPESSLSRAHRSTASAARRLQIGSVGSWEHRLHTGADYPTLRPPPRPPPLVASRPSHMEIALQILSRHCILHQCMSMQGNEKPQCQCLLCTYTQTNIHLLIQYMLT